MVGGPIANAVDRRARDRAAFYCEYSAFLEPVAEGAAHDLPGMNVSYDRTSIAAMQDLLDEGRWETWLHPRLRERGFAFWLDPTLTIDHAKDFGLRRVRLSALPLCARLRRREVRGRSGRDASLYALGAPLLPIVLGRRIVANVRRSNEDTRRVATAAPLVALYLACGPSARRSATSPAAATACTRCGEWCGSASTRRAGTTAVATAASPARRSGPWSTSTRARATSSTPGPLALRSTRLPGRAVRRDVATARRMARAGPRATSCASRVQCEPTSSTHSCSRRRTRGFRPAVSPTVVGVHDTISRELPELVLPRRRDRIRWRVKERLAIRGAARLFTVSEASRQALAAAAVERRGGHRRRPRGARSGVPAARRRRAGGRASLPSGLRTTKRSSSVRPVASARTRTSRRCSRRTRCSTRRRASSSSVRSTTRCTPHRRCGCVHGSASSASTAGSSYPGFVPDEILAALYRRAAVGCQPVACGRLRAACRRGGCVRCSSPALGPARTQRDAGRRGVLLRPARRIRARARCSVRSSPTASDNVRSVRPAGPRSQGCRGAWQAERLRDLVHAAAEAHACLTTRSRSAW